MSLHFKDRKERIACLNSQNLILLAEDREEDVIILRRAFAKAKFANPVHVVSSGEEAIAYLEGKGKYARRDEFPLPSLFLLDLKMPGKDGFAVLEWLRQQPGLSALRVVVLTSSDEIREVNRAYQMGANSFLVKPVDFPNFVEMTRALSGYWIWTSKEPEITRSPLQEISHRTKPGTSASSGSSPNPDSPED